MSLAPIKAFQWDLARQVERLDFLKKLLPRYAAWGYQELYLHLEDAVHYPSLPGVGRDDAYSYEELGELVHEAARAGIGVVPIVNLLGHTQYLLKNPAWRDLNELRDERGRPLERGQICPLHPRTAEVAEALLRDMAPYCTTGKVHVGLDESFHLGKCPRCREEVARIGLGAHFAGYVRRLHARCGAHGLRLGLWADMLYFTPEAIPLLPAGIVAYDWYYYPFNRLPRVELYNFAERDLATPLKKQGIGYYGCPMNGAFRYEPMPIFGDRLANIHSWWRRCAEVQAEGFLVTSWEAYRLALETTTAVDAATAGLWLEPESDDATAMLARGLERVTGVKHSRQQARTLLAADEYAFSGYARWQINDRWDVFAGRESVKPYERELNFFRREHLRAKREKWPAALTASLAFRTYLAERDVFVRDAARSVFQWRRWLAKNKPELVIHYMTSSEEKSAAFARALKAGRVAARTMWRRTRDPGAHGQNETILDADERRLVEWRAWLKRATREPEIIRQATPVCGTWQLQFWVHNFAPAVQKTAVEQQQPDGSWRELAARYTIEFRAWAARSESKIRREFTVPVELPGAPLRVAVSGVGQVAISHVALTDGITSRHAADFREKKVLGRRAPQYGFPNLDLPPDVLSISI